MVVVFVDFHFDCVPLGLGLPLYSSCLLALLLRARAGSHWAPTQRAKSISTPPIYMPTIYTPTI